MKAVLSKTLGLGSLALAVLLAPGAELSAHQSILKVKFAERRELNVLIDNFILTDQNGERLEFRKLRASPW